MIKHTKTLIFIANLFFIQSGLALDWEYQSDSINENEIELTLHNRPGLVSTLKVKENKEYINWNNIKKTTLFKKLNKDKYKILNELGMTEWKISSYSWMRYKFFHRLIMEGQYRNNQGTKIFFKEYHYYSQNKSWQALISDTSTKGFNYIANSFQNKIEVIIEE